MVVNTFFADAEYSSEPSDSEEDEEEQEDDEGIYCLYSIAAIILTNATVKAALPVNSMAMH